MTTPSYCSDIRIQSNLCITTPHGTGLKRLYREGVVKQRYRKLIQKKHVICACCWNFRIDQTSYTSLFYLKVDNKRTTGFSVGEQHSCRRKARFSFLHDLLQSFLSHSFSHVSVNAAVIQGIRCGIAFFKERGFVDFPTTSNGS